VDFFYENIIDVDVGVDCRHGIIHIDEINNELKIDDRKFPSTTHASILKHDSLVRDKPRIT
jgi:hypothetical protein